LEEARRWVSHQKTIKAVPRQYVDASFARSSGPGGQHVNKTNSKAVVKLSIETPFIPHWAKRELRKSPSFVESRSCLQTASTTSRSQNDNLEECLKKLHDIILEAAEQAIPSLPSEEQQAHVKRLQQIEKSKRKEEKVKRKNLKSGR
ncbi:hypothetical protein M408DRAFT_57865, partial [Serendipita vermifera MAFF 305830]